MDRKALLCQDKGNKNKEDNRVSLVIDYNRMFTGLGRTIHGLGGALHAWDDMKRIFEKPPNVSLTKPKNLKDELMRSKIKGIEGSNKGMRTFGKARCKICNFVKEGNTFCDCTGKVYYVNNGFDCDSEGVVYLLKYE